ncbi:MAG TPA: methyltransferase domain-containing protein [Ferruginibacter sp.]|jgi:2-polyprenyl-3-methyl-5-hydroxy-6-metoxy-1,4-benzoquinol methylase|nr:methyltransferase domain-containing protein [Ferruginibacter sp.]
MINLRNRSYQKELLDQDDIPFTDIRQNMKELNIVNKYLGGHKITIAGLQALIKKYPAGKTLCICEIGCGGGDNLKAISDYCSANNIPAHFIGIDIKQECIDYAKQQYPMLDANWTMSDYKLADLDKYKPDIIFSSLFCHHFPEAELVTMLQWMKTNASSGFFINDLQRHPFAYYSIKWITGLFSRSYLVKNDAPLSVARGFVKEEWQQLFNKAGISHFSIKWKWAFRYLITCSND